MFNRYVVSKGQPRAINHALSCLVLFFFSSLTLEIVSNVREFILLRCALHSDKKGEICALKCHEWTLIFKYVDDDAACLVCHYAKE